MVSIEDINRRSPMNTVPLNKLVLSDANVRKNGDAFIEQLAADIHSRGVLQNLLVTSVKKPKGHFAVFAGGRRLRALQLLAEAGKIPADYEVSVKVLAGDQAEQAETSLAENFQRLAMNPADECRAFQHFLGEIGEKGDLAAVANRFGVTVRFVEGRLRLAALAEPIFNALAEGQITLDLAKAYAATADREKQMAVFERYGTENYYGNTPDNIRRAILESAMRSNDPLARLVGEDAYVAAGGRVERDLFSSAEDNRWVDPEIVRELAQQKLEAEAKRIGDEGGYGFVIPTVQARIWETRNTLYQVDLPVEPLTEADETRLSEIEQRVVEINSTLEEDQDLSEESAEALSEEADALEEEAERIRERPPILPDEIKSQIGIIVVLQNDGSVQPAPGYFSEKPIAIAPVEPAEGEQSGEGEPETGGRFVIVEPEDKRAVSSGGSSTVQQPAPEAADPTGKKVSQRLFDELSMQRRDILSANMIGHPGLALDFMLFSLADQLVSSGYGERGTTLSVSRPQDPILTDQTPPSRARDYLAEAYDGLDTSWTSQAPGSGIIQRFDAFQALADEAKMAWLAYIVAKSLKAHEGYNASKHIPIHSRLASLMEVDVASWWRPTATNYFDRISKGASLAALEAAGGQQLSSRYGSAKKGELSSSCEKIFAGEAIIEDNIKEAALTWVPATMRFDEPQTVSATPDEEPLEANEASDSLEPTDDTQPDDEEVISADPADAHLVEA